MLRKRKMFMSLVIIFVPLYSEICLVLRVFKIRVLLFSVLIKFHF
jgi:hypothetical protein